MYLKFLCLFAAVLLILSEWPNLSEGSAARDCTVKKGICPWRKWGSGMCAEYCTKDINCPNEEKCCYNGCGHECIIPYTVKHGRCRLPMCAEYCYHDGECSGEQKCCRTTCGHACSEPS